MARVLVTGAAGFIGRHVVRGLVARGHDVVPATHHHTESLAAETHLTADLLEAASIDRLVRAAEATVLVHLAWVATPGTYWTSPLNVEWEGASIALARSFAGRGGTRIVGAGSSAEYDWSAEHVTPQTPFAPRTVYGMAKHAASTGMAAAADSGGASFAWGRVHFLFGSGEDRGRLIPSIALALLRGERALCRKPFLEREWLCVEDVADAFVALAEGACDGPIDIVGHDAVTNGAIAQWTADATGRPDLLQLGDDPRAKDEPLSIRGNAGALRKHWQPSRPLRERVAAYVDALREPT